MEGETETAKALSYDGSVIALDLMDTRKNTADGIRTANMGVCWMGLYMASHW